MKNLVTSNVRGITPEYIDSILPFFGRTVILQFITYAKRPIQNKKSQNGFLFIAHFIIDGSDYFWSVRDEDSQDIVDNWDGVADLEMIERFPVLRFYSGKHNALDKIMEANWRAWEALVPSGLAGDQP